MDVKACPRGTRKIGSRCVPKNKKYIRDLVHEYPLLYNFDYKWRDSKKYQDLNELLYDIGYELACEEVESGDYNDIKGYFNCEVIEI